MTYAEYLASPRWAALRREALERDQFRCRGCNTTERLDVHHRRYANPLGSETVDDLTTLCGGPCGCHHAIETMKARRLQLDLPEAARLPTGNTERPTVEQITALFAYDPGLGRILWRVSRSPRIKVGQEAGSVTKNGHKIVWLNGRHYQVAHIVWVLLTGQWPVNEIYHRNGDPSDNRFEHLEDITRKELCRRAASSREMKPGRSGVPLVTALGKRWTARARIGAKNIYLGVFETVPDAVAAQHRAQALAS